MNTTPNDPLTVAFEQVMRTHVFYRAARDLLASDLPGTAELIGLPALTAAVATELPDPVDEADLMFRVGRTRLVHAQFMDGDPAEVLGALLVVKGKVMRESKSDRLEQYLLVLEHHRMPDAVGLERTGAEPTIVPVYDVPLDRLLSRPTWAPLAAIPRPYGPNHGTAMGLAERAIRGARRPDEDRLLDAVEALKELP